MKVVGIIPARYESSRFPGKPLADLGGKSMIQRVYERCSASRVLDQVIVATDHQGIYDHVEGFGGKVAMTKSTHQSGTDRCAEVLASLQVTPEVIVNIQGDEPFILSEQIESLVSLFEDGKVDIGTLVKQIKEEETLWDPNTPKVVLDSSQNALYFSRQTIPYLRDVPKEAWLSSHTYFKHIGIYAYRSRVLSEISLLAQGALERAESLEQLRWLQAGYRIRVAETIFESMGIDTPEQLEAARLQFE